MYSEDLPHVRDSNDLWEPQIRHDAPLYALDSSPGLIHHLGKELVGQSHFLQFPSSKEPILIDAETGARWDPLELPQGHDHWFRGIVSINEDRVGDYFYDYLFKDTGEAFLPEMFSWDELVVSERVRDLISAFAPGCCYFSPVSFLRMISRTPTDTPYFKAFVRQNFDYSGPSIRNFQIKSVPQVNRHTWKAFCQSPELQALAFDEPIFLFERSKRCPILSRALFQHLKKHKVTGLLEATENFPGTTRPGAHLAFETVFPLTP